MILPQTSLETALLQAFPDYAIESLRTRFLFATTTDHVDDEAARATVQMAYETELATALTRTIAIEPGIAEELVETRRRFLAIDADMTSFAFLVAPAFTAITTLGVLPGSYVRLLESYTEAPTPKYRVCALAVVLCFAAAHFGDL